jgi:hypothetical protein
MPNYRIKSEIVDLHYENMTGRIVVRVKENKRNLNNIMLDRTFRKSNNDVMKIYKLNSPMELIQEDKESKIFKAKNISKINGEMYIYYDKHLKRYFEIESEK